MSRAVGLHTVTLLGLQRMLLESPNFLRWTASPTVWDGAKRVKHFSFAEDPALMQGARPFALVLSADQAALVAASFGQSTEFWPEAQATLLLTDTDRAPLGAAAGQRRADYERFAGWCDLVLSDLRALAGVDDRLPIDAIRTAWPASHSPARDDAASGPYWHAAFLLSWGGK